MNDRQASFSNFSCPFPLQDYPKILLAHGGGGQLMRQLIEKMFVHAFDNPQLQQKHDGAVFSAKNGRIALTTDSYVVHPLFFPGGDIGSLAIHGTVNDLAMCGARPRYLTAGFILEEGLAVEVLWKIVQSMQAAAIKCGVQIVTGDTKVVDRGKGDGIFINTAGVGFVETDAGIGPQAVHSGDVILLSGDIGRHGIAIMAQREGLEFETTIESDSMPVADVVMALLNAGVDVHSLRDLTRGGLAAAIVETAETRGLDIQLDENAIPVAPQVRGACEILGLDPLYIANEGRFIAVVDRKDANRALEIMRGHPQAPQPAIIGTVQESSSGIVSITGQIGTSRILDLPSGEQLPRIC